MVGVAGSSESIAPFERAGSPYERRHLVAGPLQRDGGVGAYRSGGTGDENLHVAANGPTS
ncbi:MAG: hypothetical protein R2714_12840 [Microthrixaceae bacterium]